MTNALLVTGLFLCLILIFWNIVTEKRLRYFFKGTKAKSLEQTISDLIKESEIIKKENKEIKEHLLTVDQRLKKTVRNVETVRFNPFPDQGSNQSFATALVNDEGSGVVISTLYSRERMSIFAKPIKEGKAEYELTAEEKDVLSKTL